MSVALPSPVCGHHGQAAEWYFFGNILCRRDVVGYWSVTVCIHSLATESGIDFTTDKTTLQFFGSLKISLEKVEPFMQLAILSTPKTA